VLRFVGLLCLAALGLQLYFALRIAAMAWVDPQSTSFERSQMWRQLQEKDTVRWSQTWRDDAQLGQALKRAVIASEDDSFASHDGIDWVALEKAWSKNSKAEERAAQRAAARRVRGVRGDGGDVRQQHPQAPEQLQGEGGDGDRPHPSWRRIGRPEKKGEGAQEGNQQQQAQHH
jgi:monofunctional biosynthetic peptidoglycan transglycosylase